MSLLNQSEFFSMLDDPKFAAIFILLSVWSLAWKGVALWRAARNNSMQWFIPMLIVNTLGILEIIYIFYFSKPKAKNPE